MRAHGPRHVFYVVTVAILLAGCAQNKADGDRPQYMTKAERDQYTPGFQSSCLTAQKSDPLGKHLSDAQQNQYCSCAANRSAETVTLEQLGTYIRTGSRDHLMPHYREIALYCVGKLLPIWLPEANQRATGGVLNSDADLIEMLKRKNTPPSVNK